MKKLPVPLKYTFPNQTQNMTVPYSIENPKYYAKNCLASSSITLILRAHPPVPQHSTRTNRIHTTQANHSADKLHPALVIIPYTLLHKKRKHRCINHARAYIQQSPISDVSKLDRKSQSSRTVREQLHVHRVRLVPRQVRGKSHLASRLNLTASIDRASICQDSWLPPDPRRSE